MLVNRYENENYRHVRMKEMDKVFAIVDYDSTAILVHINVAIAFVFA